MAEICPPECKQDRDMLHKEIKDKTAGLKWFFGIFIVVLIAICSVLYSGISSNSSKIGQVHARITVELGEFRKEIGKELNELSKVVIRMDERAKLADDRIKLRELKDEKERERDR
jgi:hypothetical protein